MTFRPKQNGGGTGLTNPMPNGTFLQTVTDSALTFNLAGYSNDLGAAVFGDLVTGVNTSIGTTDDFTTFFSGIAMNGTKTEAFSSDITNGRETVVSWDSASFEYEIKTEDPAANPLGFNYNYRYLSDLPADDDILATVQFAGNESDGVNPVAEVVYAKDIISIKQVDPTVGTGSTGQINKYIRADGADLLYETIDNRGIISRAITNLDAVIVTGGVSFLRVETSFATGVYANIFGGGTVVPGAVTGWSTGAIFTDGDATTYNRLWINTGNSSSADFQRIATLNANGQLAFDAGSAALPIFSSASDPDTGMFSGGANTLAFSTGGTSRMQINSGTNVNFSLPINYSSGTNPAAATYGHGRASTELVFNVPTGATHQFRVNNVTSVTFGANTIGFNGATAVAQGGAIASPTGGATVDSEARTAITSLLVYLRSRGDIAT